MNFFIKLNRAFAKATNMKESKNVTKNFYKVESSRFFFLSIVQIGSIEKRIDFFFLFFVVQQNFDLSN